MQTLFYRLIRNSIGHFLQKTNDATHYSGFSILRIASDKWREIYIKRSFKIEMANELWMHVVQLISAERVDECTLRKPVFRHMWIISCR